MVFIKELGSDTPCFKIPSLIKKIKVDFSCSNKITWGRLGKMNLSTDTSPSGDRYGVFSLFTVVVKFCLGYYARVCSPRPVHGQPHPQEHQQVPKATCETQLGSSRFTRELRCFLTWVSSIYFSINCVYVM